jgi:hypothetical protein
MILATPLKVPRAAVAQNPIEATSSILCSKFKHKKFCGRVRFSTSVMWWIFSIVRCLTFQVWLNSCLHDLFSCLKSGGIWDRIQNLNHFYDPAISILVDYFKIYSVNNTTKFQSYKVSVDIMNRLWDGQSRNRVSILGRDKGLFVQLQPSYQLLDSSTILSNWHQGFFPQGLNGFVLKISTDINLVPARRHIYIIPFVFMASCWIMHMHNLVKQSSSCGLCPLS